MATVHSILTNFTAGELSPRLYGRVDIAKYQNGARELTNFKVLPQGGASKRGGTEFINQVKNNNTDAILVPFKFSTLQAYQLEFGEYYIRVYKDRGIISDAQFDITGIVRGSATTITVPGHTFVNGDHVILNDIGGTVELNNREFIVANAASNTFQLTASGFSSGVPIVYYVDSSTYGAYTGGGTASRVLEIVTSYSADDVANLTFTQSADTLYIFSGQWPLTLLTRNSHTDWVLSTANVEEGPFLDMNIDEDNRVSLDVASGNAVMTFSKDTFEASHVGALFRIWEYADGSSFGYAQWAPGASVTVANDTFWEYKGNVYFVVSGGGETMSSTAAYPTHTHGTADIFYGSSGGIAQMRYEHSGYCVVQITEVVDTKNAFADIVKYRTPYSAYGARSSTQWQEGAWSDKRGYPITGTFDEQRLVAAYTENQPSTVWGSTINAYLNFKDGDKDTDSFTYTIGGEEVDAILYMVGGKRLALFATGAEHVVQASSQNQAITPTNVKVSSETSYGTAYVRPIKVGAAILFAQRAGKNDNAARKLREFVYNFQTDSYVAPDLTILSDHITYPGLINGAFTPTPDLMVWYPRLDGKMAAVTYERDQQVVGWHKHELGGSGLIKYVSSIPGERDDELWMIVERGIDGETRRYVEILTQGLYDDDDLADAFFVDCGLRYDGSAADEITGLWHLNGETIDALCDGAPVLGLTVTNGKVTFANEYSKINLGYSFTSRLKTLHLEGGAQGGTSQGAIQRVFQIIIRLYKSIGGTYGRDENHQDPIPYRDEPLATPIEPFTGDRELAFEGEWDRDGYLCFEHSDPLPFCISALVIGKRVSG